MRVVAFDMGIRNFAFACVDLDTTLDKKSWGYVRFIDVHDFKLDSSCNNIYRQLISYLDEYRQLWVDVDVILIEQQLNRYNISASKMACHTSAYFFHNFPEKTVFEYPSTYKTRYLSNHVMPKHRDRKMFAIKLVLDYYENEDPLLCDWIKSFPKYDDIADCILMCNTFIQSPLFTQFLGQ